MQSYEEAAGNHVWLRDILPSQLHERENRQPMVRVMTYGYQPLLERDNALATFDDLGDAFLRALSTLSSSSSTRPIIFMGHGIGGLIMKQVCYPLLILDLMSLNDPSGLGVPIQFTRRGRGETLQRYPRSGLL